MKLLERTLANLDQNVIREKIVNGVLNIASIIGISIIVINIFRIDMKSVSNAIYIYSLLYFIVLFITLFKDKIPLIIKAFTVVFIPLVGGIVALYHFSLAGPGWTFLAASTIFSAILISYIASAVIFFLCFFSISFIGWSFTTQKIPLLIDLNEYSLGSIAWASILVDYSIISIAIISAFYFLNKALVVSVTQLKRQNYDLLKQIDRKTKKLKEEKERAEELARRDFLTGLNNRRAFFEFAHQVNKEARRYENPYSIIMIDIDHFKNVNDTFGHQIGDVAIQSVASCLEEITRDCDISARIGGEEFAVLLPHTRHEKVITLAERLREGISNISITTEKGIVTFTASFGIASFNEETNNMEEVLINSDTALYKAKESGRNQIVVY